MLNFKPQVDKIKTILIIGGLMVIYSKNKINDNGCETSGGHGVIIFHRLKSILHHGHHQWSLYFLS